MSKQNETIIVSTLEMQSTFEAILLKNGFSQAKATECAAVFTNNSVDGIYTHGVNRFPRFIQYIQKGLVNSEAEPTLKHKFGGIEQWDGNLGAGPSNATKFMF